jgi:hypothetical protein
MFTYRYTVYLCALLKYHKKTFKFEILNVLDMLKKVEGILKRLLIGYMNMHVHVLMV